jgi:4-hydroxy-2-oxoheptanedioate aldolase
MSMLSPRWLDMLFVGPNDLSLSLGNGSKSHMECPDTQEAIVQIRQAAERAGKCSGIFCMSAAEASRRFEEGFQFVNLVRGTLHIAVSYVKSLV